MEQRTAGRNEFVIAMHMLLSYRVDERVHVLHISLSKGGGRLRDCCCRWGRRRHDCLNTAAPEIVGGSLAMGWLIYGPIDEDRDKGQETIA